MTHTFTTESISAGHPDKICDRISDALLDLHLKSDPKAHTAIEALATTNRVIISGEVSAQKLPASDEIEHCIRQTVKTIGYEQAGFDWHTLQIENYLHRQSIDISNGISNVIVEVFLFFVTVNKAPYFFNVSLIVSGIVNSGVSDW